VPSLVENVQPQSLGGDEVGRSFGCNRLLTTVGTTMRKLLRTSAPV
jgi:hypothetical protein